ncbi:MAG: hypothetical protein DMG69_31570 [Acidobacteria bacterium]|nr:MAG: hypothetical protein DMG69_31570 [Acidobacteriota bacterium]
MSANDPLMNHRNRASLVFHALRAQRIWKRLGSGLDPFQESYSIAKPSLEERLGEYPELRAKIETMLAIIENAGGDVEKAAEAERRIIEELRQMGNQVLHSWARRQQQKKEEEHSTQPGVNRKEKTSTGTGDWEKSKYGSRSLPEVVVGRRFAPFPSRQKWSAEGARKPCDEPSPILVPMIPLP